MANRWFQQFRFSLEKYVVDLYAHVTFGAAGAPTMDVRSSKGIASITRTETGTYAVRLQDSYYRFLMANNVFLSPAPSATNMFLLSEDVANSAAPIIEVQFTSYGAPSASEGAGPSLGEANRYSVLAGSAITNTGSGVVTGDLGSYPTDTVTGFPPGVVVGTTHHSDASVIQAKTDLTAAYVALAALPFDVDESGVDLGTLTLGPGVYKYSTSAGLTGTLTLDASGDPDAVFVFQIGTTLTTAAASAVSLINGAQAKNVYWQIGSSATLGTTTDFAGNIIALTSITVTTGATVNGRTLARNGAVSLDTNAVSNVGIPAPAAGNNATDPAAGDEVYLQFSLSNSGAL